MFKLLLITSILVAATGCHSSQKMKKTNMETREGSVKDSPLLSRLLRANPVYFDSLLDNPDYGVQIIYTQINRQQDNQPVLTDHYFHVSNQYFYPASTVKFPTALLALQRLHELNIPGLDRNTRMVTDSAYSGQVAVSVDSTSENLEPSIGQYVRRILLVSDNDAFNRLYEFLGQQYINDQLHKMGYADAQIIHRLNIFLSEDENRHTNPVSFYNAESKVIYQKPMENSQMVYARRNDKKGIGYYAGGKLVNEPFDFSKKNRLSLSDLHSIMKSFLFPQAVEPGQRFNLTKEDEAFVKKYMSMFPRESGFPSYDSSYQDAYSRFLLWGEGKEKQIGTIRIFHKSGDAYGFLTDVAYVVDFEHNIEFMLSATILCNRDGIFNDDHYDYDSIGLPFMKHLGEVIYNYELKRERKVKPDLSDMKFDYTPNK